MAACDIPRATNYGCLRYPEGDKLWLLEISRDYVELQCVVAVRSAKTLPSDPEYLLSLMSQIGKDSESDDEFDGWLDDDHSERDDETGPAPRADVQCH